MPDWKHFFCSKHAATWVHPELQQGILHTSWFAAVDDKTHSLFQFLHAGEAIPGADKVAACLGPLLGPPDCWDTWVDALVCSDYIRATA
jgi:hypothetical protein